MISNLLVVDIDHNDALIRSMWDRESWRPNAVVENPTNGHAHAVWALKAPFARTEYARRKPLAYATAVVEGLRRSVDGDRGYSGLITKTRSTNRGTATRSPTTCTRSMS
ncbi:MULTISPECIES: replication initiation protein [Corynebacterium]|uniref:replication initiation protein n=1 Tax=Corynebacterium TaxID=1716 RepID=UPI002542D311|nr:MULTISPECIES: replication initiation protein [Corynebacterium]MDK4238553.1 replication initiation protein [Corynebacterium propinquum]MDK8845862.1 replication initiation protein [Corynebacterium sp. MSK297]